MTKRLQITLFIILTFFIVCQGCASKETRRTVKAMLKSELILPTNMLEITNGIVKTYHDNDINKALMVIYYDKAECGSCRISKLNMLDTLYNLSETSDKFNMLVVFSPNEEEFNEILSLSLIPQHYNLTL